MLKISYRCYSPLSCQFNRCIEVRIEGVKSAKQILVPCPECRRPMEVISTTESMVKRGFMSWISDYLLR